MLRVFGAGAIGLLSAFYVIDGFKELVATAIILGAGYVIRKGIRDSIADEPTVVQNSW